MTAPDPGAIPTIGWITLDAHDTQALARWWQGLLGGEIRVDQDGDVFLESGSLPLLFLQNDDLKTVKNRMHLDLRVERYDDAVARALALGATPADDVHRCDDWRVLRDPEGNEFCIIRPKGAG